MLVNSEEHYNKSIIENRSDFFTAYVRNVPIFFGDKSHYSI